MQSYPPASKQPLKNNVITAEHLCVFAFVHLFECLCVHKSLVPPEHATGRLVLLFLEKEKKQNKPGWALI